MTRIKITMATAAVASLAFFASSSTAQAQLNLGYNPGFGGLNTYNSGYGYGGVRNAGYGFNRPSSLYGGNYANNYGGYGTPYNYYLANRAALTPNVYNSALPYGGGYNNGLGGLGSYRSNFQYRYNNSPFGGLNYRYRYNNFFRR